MDKSRMPCCFGRFPFCLIPPLDATYFDNQEASGIRTYSLGSGLEAMRALLFLPRSRPVRVSERLTLLG
jgi:hypothetical protein